MFEGKVIKYINADGIEYNARVVACVKDVGITLVDNDNPSYYLRCLVMKNAPNFWSGKGEITSTRKKFTKFRKGIMSGILDLRNCYGNGAASSASCPFGQ